MHPYTPGAMAPPARHAHAKLGIFAGRARHAAVHASTATTSTTRPATSSSTRYHHSQSQQSSSNNWNRLYDHRFDRYESYVDMADDDGAATSLPLLGMVLCCTGVEQDERIDICTKAAELGARNVLDLTSDVTHLLCGAVGSPKYAYVARMRSDVLVLHTGWVRAVHTAWLSGDDVDARALASSWRFPALSGIAVSVTGVADVAERRRIEEAVEAQGGSYHPDLTKAVTHLLAAAPVGKKYDFAVHQGISVVALEWLEDSLARGMALEAKYYDLRLPPERIGVGAKPEVVQRPVAVAEYGWKRKIRKQTEERLGSQSRHIWDDIIGHASAVRPAVRRDEWQDGEDAAEGGEEDDDDDAPVAPGRRSKAATATPQPQRKLKPFGSACFYVWGFDGTQTHTLRAVIEGIDGSIVTSAADLEASPRPRHFALIPRATRNEDRPLLGAATAVVTEWWLELCMHTHSLVEPTPDDITTMAIDEFPLPALQGMEVCITQFTGIDLLHWGRLVPLMGLTLCATLIATRELLIIHSTPAKGPKFNYAVSHNIPVVTSDWLLACIREKTKVPYDAYLVRRIERADGADQLKRENAEHQPRRPMLGDKFNKRKNQPSPAPGGTSPSKRMRAGESMADAGAEAGRRTQSMLVGTPRGGRPARTSRILEGCTICSRAAELNALATSLGAAVLDTFQSDSPLTHLIHISASAPGHDTTRDVKLALAINAPIVSPGWLTACLQSGQREPESSFPPLPPPATSPTPSSSAASTLTPPPPTSDTTATATADSIALSRTDSDLSEMLTKFGPSQLASAMDAPRKPRGRLQGRAVPGTNRGFSRTPSLVGEAGPGGGEGPPSTQVVLSQGIGYTDEEAERERTRVRRRLDPAAVAEQGTGVGRPVGVEAGTGGKVAGQRRSKRKSAAGTAV
ncbi:hypothetical protein EDC01DRAFT_783841 [Geopyxis carbonaria]|nr:hypothetical protein EDC01DRAFT_783841 [Geopyxis carbonaria]